MFAPMLKIEFKKLFRRRLLWVEMAVLAIMVAGFFTALFLMHEAGVLPEDLEAIEDVIAWPDSLITSLGFASGQSLGGLLVVILVSMVVAQEYNWDTMSLWLRQGVGRRTVLAAKFVVLLVSVVLLTLAPLVVGGILSALMTPSIAGELDMSQVDFAEVGLSALRTAYTLVPYLGLTFLFAVLTRSLAFSIGVGVGYALVIEGVISQLMMLVGGVPAKIAMWLPGQMAAAISQLNQSIFVADGEEADFVLEYLDPNIAAIGIAVYAAVFIGIAFWRFQKQDLTA
jgi:ABC-2 type transport system permease protein